MEASSASPDSSLPLDHLLAVLTKLQMLHLSAEGEGTSQHILSTKSICVFMGWRQQSQVSSFVSLPPMQVHLLAQHAHWLLLFCYTTTGEEPKSKCVLIKVPSVISNQKREMKIMQEYGLELKAREYSQTSQQGAVSLSFPHPHPPHIPLVPHFTPSLPSSHPFWGQMAFHLCFHMSTLFPLEDYLWLT